MPGTPDESVTLVLQNAVFKKHVVERAELSVRHAREWIIHFINVKDPANVKHWTQVLEWRTKSLIQLSQHDFQDREYKISNDE